MKIKIKMRKKKKTKKKLNKKNITQALAVTNVFIFWLNERTG